MGLIETHGIIRTCFRANLTTSFFPSDALVFVDDRYAYLIVLWIEGLKRTSWAVVDAKIAECAVSDGIAHGWCAVVCYAVFCMGDSDAVRGASAATTIAFDAEREEVFALAARRSQETALCGFSGRRALGASDAANGKQRDYTDTALDEISS